MKTTRREFVCGAACLVALPASGCAAAPSVRATVDATYLRVLLAQWPEGADVVVARREDHKSPVIVVRNGGEYEAVSSICPHQGCIVRPGPEGLVCPCHGSVFALDGAVERGPARENLTRFATRVEGDELVISTAEVLS